jgi:tRNA A-37 threonylcarbamoyl transferase component Bud32
MEAMQSLEGQVLGHYQIIAQVDEGGMATIYKAVDTHLERNVAIKIIRKENFSPVILDQVLKRFEREAKSLAQLSHPNIVKVIDYGEYENSPYLVMEFLSGGNLKQRLQEKVNVHAAVGWLIPISHALSYAHHRGVIHRDVKPSNILFTETNEPMLTDFGIAKILEAQTGDSLTGSGVGIGTPEYMAPEQGLGQTVDARTDIYALGIVLYEILTGRRPFQADTPMSIVLKHLNEPLPSPRQFDPTISELAEQILMKALAKKPDDRYADMAAFSAALSKLVGQYATDPGRSGMQDTLNIGMPAAVHAAAGQGEGSKAGAEEDTGKLLMRISRLEKVVQESLAAEDFDDAADLIATISGLGEHGRQVAARLNINLEQARQKARQRDADISNIRIAFPKALEAEDIAKAEAMLLQLRNLGPKGEALAGQFKIAIETARQQAALRQTEITRLTTLTEQSLAGQDFAQAEAYILSLSVMGTQGKAQAARLQEALEKSQQQTAQRKAEVYRLTGVVEQTMASTPISKPVQPAAPQEGKRGLPRLTWIAVGAVVVMLCLAAGGVAAVRLITRQIPTQAVSQGQENIPAGELGQTQEATEPLAAGLATATAAVVEPSPTIPPSPTASKTAVPSRTPTPRPTLTPTLPLFEGTVDEDYANIRNGPGTVYNIIQSLPRGTVLQAVGRNAAGDWLVVKLNNGKDGWISTRVMQYNFDASLLPVVQAPPTPVIPTKKPTEEESGGGSSGGEATWTPPPP